MPLKNTRHQHHKKHPRHYAKVYWPYMPLLLIMGLSLIVGQSFVARSQRGVLSYATDVNNSQLLAETNQARQETGANELSLDTKLTEAAQAKADDMVARNYWSHTTPEGNAPWVFVDKADYKYQKVGENLAYGFLSSSETVNGWMRSESHRNNMLDLAYTEVGFGIASSPDYLGVGPETIIVAMYARPSSADRLPANLKLADITTVETPVNSNERIIAEPAVQSVSKIQAMSIGSVPGLSFILGLLAGAGVMLLVVRHGIRLKRVIKDGEKFAVTHPLLDITILSFAALVVLLSQGVGYIR